MTHTTHKKMISHLTLAFSNASVAQFQSVLREDTFPEIKEFFYSKKWKKMVADHSKHLTPRQAFGFGSALSTRFGEQKPFEDFVKNCASFTTYLNSLKTPEKSSM